jgi:hypothetical protein
MRANLPDYKFFIDKTIPSRPDMKIISYIKSGNDGLLFRTYSEELGRDNACKIIPRKNLQLGTDGTEKWRAEILKANALRNSTVVKVEQICEWRGVPMKPELLDPERIDCIALISEFVDGQSLRDFIKDNRKEVTVSFIVHWLETMLNLFFEMKQQNVKHSDLHAGNILVEDRSSYDLMGSSRFGFRVTDFGVGDTTSEPRFKDDYLQLAAVLADLLRLINYQTCSPKDKFTYNVLRDHFYSRHLQETDPTRDPIAKHPDALFQRLMDLDSEFEHSGATDPTQLLTPFDYLSCEQIGEAAGLLHALYSDRFLGLSEIVSQNNIVVTGPRGCGKSTVFRSLGLDQKMRVNEANPDYTQYLGVYYRCDDLYFTFPRYKAISREGSIDIPIHFVTATLLSKLLGLIERWARQYFPDDFNQNESRVSQALWAVIGINPPHVPGCFSFKTIISTLDRERLNAAKWQRFVNDPKHSIGQNFGPEVLQKACKALSNSFSFIRARPIYFFIDDYSSPKVTKELQASLNRLFMQRTSVCFFKLSTESPVSFVRYDIDGKIYVENREFILHNLGVVYLHAKEELKLTFIEDVFRRRLKSSANNFPAKELVELVGSNAKQNNNEIARGIRKGEKVRLWGKETICSLCSGDIHYLISLVEDMVKQAGGPIVLAKIEDQFKVSTIIQDRSVRAAAGSFLKNLRGVPKYGEQLVAIVEAFGNVANSHLKFLDSKNEEDSPPKQATRIEPYAPFTLTVTAQYLYDELLRYSIFIEDYRGKSRRGNVVPRLYLRRFLIPHFNLTFSTRDSIELEPADVEVFLTNPKSFDQKFRLKSLEDAQRLTNKIADNSSQVSLDLEYPRE